MMCVSKDQLQTDRVLFRTSDAALNTCASGGTVARIFPNPGSSDFTLEWSAEQHSDVELTLYDINGRSVKRQNLQQSHGSNRASIDMSHVAPGIYIGRLQSTAGTSFSFKWIKQ